MSAGPQRVRRPIAERFRDFVHNEYPLDRTGDQRIGELLDQLKGERDRRGAGGDSSDDR